MSIQRPLPFGDRDLNLEVRLQTCVGGNFFDLTGRKAFTAEMFRESVGFGITSIDIEVNPSLQPIVEITFKDIYGNTAFGTQSRSSGYDYSVLFDWPPPKFLLTIKGYLGSPITWMLNLKKTSTGYISSDGSYEIKATFVPNQWGFFADIPFLFLMSVKGLKKRSRGLEDSDLNKPENDTIFDYIKIGKQVDVETKETTKEFDGILKQMASLRGNVIPSLFNSKSIKFDEPIIGSVNGVNIQGFSAITITRPFGLKEETLKDLSTNNASTIRKANALFLLNAKINGVNNFDIRTIDINTFNPDDPLYESELKQRKTLIDENIRKINDEIIRRSYNSSKSKIRKLTISEVFSRLAKDSAYIMGRILQAGFDGINNNPSRTDSEASRRLIGQGFPLEIESGTNNQIPAKGVGVESYEMKFVKEFIEAISEGIAESKKSEVINSGFESNRIKNRINNLEILKGNPYKPNYSNIITNIMLRSGIIGHMTRSYDPSRPGDYLNGVTNPVDNDSLEEIIQLTDKEFENIGDGIISQLSNDDFLKLKRFAKFWNRLISEDGTDYLNASGEKVGLDGEFQINPSAPVSNNLLDYKVVMESRDGFDLNDQNILSNISNAAGFDIIDVKTFLNEIFNDSNEEMKFIDRQSYTTDKIVNNGIPYFWPNFMNDKYFFVMFEGEDVTEASSANSAESDMDNDFKKSENKDIRNLTSAFQEAPYGFIKIDRFKDDNGDVFGRIKTANEYINGSSAGRMVDYRSLVGLLPHMGEITRIGSGVTFSKSLWTKEIVDENSSNINSLTQVKASKLGYIVFGHQDHGDLPYPEKHLMVWGLFMDRKGGVFSNSSHKGRNQRASLKRICRNLEDKINSIEEEVTNTIGSVLGKSAEQENLLYHQFHILFHQWSAVALETIQSETSNGVENTCTSVYMSGDDLGTKLEEVYGKRPVNSSNPSRDDVKDVTFIYEYPYDTVKNDQSSNIKVENSIINIDPLYKPDSNTTVLNIIQNICQKNNFIFVPVAGNANYKDITDIYKPYNGPINTTLRNYFHVIFAPTPESRSSLSNTGKDPLALFEDQKNSFGGDALLVEFGSVDNQVIKNISVSTDENKVTAESIVNLQRLVDNENTNKTVTTDCSMLSVLEGRSYKATCETWGNAQIYPMQYFFVDKMPLFGGLYQIMKVRHNIVPNDMKTTFEGIRMRFSPGAGDFGGVQPITLETLEALGSIEGSNISRSEGPFEDSNTFSESIQPITSQSLQSGAISSLGLGNPASNLIITSRMGNRTSPVAGGSTNHKGIDVGIPVGTPLYAIKDGTISLLKLNADGYGLYAILTFYDDNKNKYEALYAHMSNVSQDILPAGINSVEEISSRLKSGVIPSRKVVRGQQIGISGGKKGQNLLQGSDFAGTSSGPHLHFEIREIPKGASFFSGAITHDPMKLLPGPFYDRNGNNIS